MDNIFDKRPVIELTMKPFYEIRKIKKDEKGNNTYEEWAETIGAYIVAEKEKFILDKLYDICKEKDIATSECSSHTCPSCSKCFTAT